MVEEAKTAIIAWLETTTGVPIDELSTDRSFAEIGLDSLDAVHMVAMVESLLGKELPGDVLQRVACLDDLFEIMARRVAAA